MIILYFLLAVGAFYVFDWAAFQGLTGRIGDASLGYSKFVYKVFDPIRILFALFFGTLISFAVINYPERIWGLIAIITLGVSAIRSIGQAYSQK